MVALRLAFYCLLQTYFVATLAKTIGPVATLVVQNTDLSPDGIKRRASVINGVHPAPLLVAKEGEKFKLKVVNRLQGKDMFQGTSIHWHGFTQKHTNYFDGAAYVSQCPISPQHSFEYEFEANSPGTYWYHSHHATQYCDGVRGPLIVYDRHDPLKGSLYDVDDESTVITLADWYHVLSAGVTGPAFPDSTLINGLGRFPGGPLSDLAVINVQHGKRYRFRVIGISCEAAFQFSIDGHDLTIIEADGSLVQPHTVDSIQVLTGQRYSVVVCADQPVGNYWLRALPSIGANGTTTLGFENGTNSAILRYKGAKKEEPTTTPKADPKALSEFELHPSSPHIIPGNPWFGGADLTLNLSLSIDLPTLRFFINNATYTPPSVPVLLQLLSGTANADTLQPKGSLYQIRRGQVVDLVIKSATPTPLLGAPHPFHLHGHRFYVIKSANSSHFNFLNPILRDTVDIGQFDGDFAVIRFQSDNPGSWLLHCHLDFHFKGGLAVVFAEDPDRASVSSHPSGAWNELCPIWDSQPDDVKNEGQIPAIPPSAPAPA